MQATLYNTFSSSAADFSVRLEAFFTKSEVYSCNNEKCTFDFVSRRTNANTNKIFYVPNTDFILYIYIYIYIYIYTPARVCVTEFGRKSHGFKCVVRPNIFALSISWISTKWLLLQISLKTDHMKAYKTYLTIYNWNKCLFRLISHLQHFQNLPK
jgi:hypothetical protein